MRLTSLFVLMLISSAVFADPFARLGGEVEQKKMPDVQVTEPAEAKTEEADKDQPQLAVQEIDTAATVPLPETYFSNQEAAAVYHETPHGDQKDVEEYFDTYNFAYRDIPSPHEVVPSLQERKRRVAQAIAEQQKNVSARVPQNPLEHTENHDNVQEPITNTTVNDE